MRKQTLLDLTFGGYRRVNFNTAGLIGFQLGRTITSTQQRFDCELPNGSNAYTLTIINAIKLSMSVQETLKLKCRNLRMKTGQWLLITSDQHPCFMIMVSVDNTSGPASQRKEECTLQCALSSKEEKSSSGNPVKKILLKLNLSDHRLFKDGGGVPASRLQLLYTERILEVTSIKVKEFQRSFCHSNTERLSRSDEVLKLKKFKKDAKLKLFKSTNQVRYEHVGPTITRWKSLQDGETRLCLVDDLKVFKITYSHTSQDKEQAQA
ncbi:hypothetical protein Tco_0256927 [Tanacetum coccineum]